jgi:hypothetical protein
MSSSFLNPGTMHLEKQESSRGDFIDADVDTEDGEGSNMTNPLHGRPSGKPAAQQAEPRKFSTFQSARKVFLNMAPGI